MATWCCNNTDLAPRHDTRVVAAAAIGNANQHEMLSELHLNTDRAGLPHSSSLVDEISQHETQLNPTLFPQHKLSLRDSGQSVLRTFTYKCAKRISPAVWSD